MPCQEDKALIGSLPSLKRDTNQLSTMDLTTLKDSLNEANPPITNTGNCSSSPRKKRRYVKSGKYSVLNKPTMNLPDQQQLKTTSGKKTQESENHLNLEKNHSKETPQPIGKKSENSQKQEILMTSQQIFLFVVTLHSAESVQTIFNQLRWIDQQLFIGAQLELASRIGLGNKEVITHTIKIRAPNFGMATLIKNALSSMNFAVQSISPISLDGLTATQCVLKLKVPPKSFKQNDSSSRLISTLVDGIPTWTLKHTKHLKEEFK